MDYQHLLPDIRQEDVDESENDPLYTNEIERKGKEFYGTNSGHWFKRNLWILFSFALNVLSLVFLLLYALSQARQPSAAVVRKIQPRLDFMSLDHAYDHLWTSLLINRSYTPVIQTGIHDRWHGYAAITMFHQLHCLQTIRTAMQQAREGNDPGVDQLSDRHWPHCFDYLVQSIQCYADNTLERAPIRNDVLGNTISGYEEKRHCQDANILYEMLELHGVKKIIEIS